MEVYTLRALEDFRCVGSECTRTCCKGWSYIVDSQALEKWKNISEEGEKQWFLQSTMRDESSDEIELKSNNGKRCCYLNDEQLCEIQLRYDQSFLPKGCREFPRIEIVSPYRVYKTATFSCPEIVKLVFFENLHVNPFNKSALDGAEPIPASAPSSIDLLCFELDKFVTKILDLVDFPLGIRVYYITGVFMEMIALAQRNEENMVDFNQLNDNSKRSLNEIITAVNQGQLKPDPVTAGSFWKVIFSLARSLDIDPMFFESDISPLSNIIRNSGSSHEDYENIYKVVQNYIDSTRPILRHKHHKLLHTYLKVYFITEGFPLSPQTRPLIVCVVKCMVGLCTLQMFLWMQLREGNTLSDQMLQDLIIEIHRKYMHGNTIANRLEEDGRMKQIDKYCECFLDLF